MYLCTGDMGMYLYTGDMGMYQCTGDILAWTCDLIGVYRLQCREIPPGERAKSVQPNGQ